MHSRKHAGLIALCLKGLPDFLLNLQFFLKLPLLADFVVLSKPRFLSNFRFLPDLLLFMCFLILPAACTLLRGPSHKTVHSKDAAMLPEDMPPRGTTFQLMVGIAEYDDLAFRQASASDPGIIAETEIDSMPFMGVAAQAPLAGE